MTVNDRVVVGVEHFGEVLAALKEQGFSLVGPTVRDGAIVYDHIESTADLPVGWTDVQEPGRYRLERRDDEALFGYNVGPHAWKQFLHLPVLRLWRAERKDGGLAIQPETPKSMKLALVGVRGCELHAIGIQDKVFLGGAHTDPHYAARRADVFVLAVNCVQAGGTCFCTSMSTGPRVSGGYDLAVTELIGSDQHTFLVEIGSEAGVAAMQKVTTEPAPDAALDRADRAVARAAEQMGRTLDTTDIKELLYRNLDHPRWEETAERCLACANCTMVCPTCFCTTVEDVTDLTGQSAERIRQWDSCFTMPFSYIAGGSVRPTIKARYRQWLTHKMAGWIDQFGTSGCVGCGRCITWCPPGIDLTEEVGAIRAADHGSVRKPA